ncbi:MAG TPA: hypothetical protein EYN79_10985 [Planctomycetes bacterium]|nr:hypothetical protein [Planctomycetota bacterium]
MKTQQKTIFQVESFKSPKQWIYFCVEFDLEVCVRCHRQARKKEPGQRSAPWRCQRCDHPASDALPIHDALWQLVDSRVATRLSCDLCGEQVSIRDCWVSDDCQRLYCSRHLRRVETADRLRLVHRHLSRWSGGRNGVPTTENSWREQVESHFKSSPCFSCGFNSRAVYDGDRLVEIDRDRRRCSSAPDALNCAGVPN